MRIRVRTVPTTTYVHTGLCSVRAEGKMSVNVRIVSLMWTDVHEKVD